MANGEQFKKMYKSGNTPWDAGQPDFNLIDVVREYPIQSCTALKIGCGTGDNTIWLTQNNFQAVGVDISDIAVEKAKEKAAKANSDCTFIPADFLEDKIKGAPFGFVFDRGCLHPFDSVDDRRRYSENVAAVLEKSGLWLSLVGNADEDNQGPGPPRRSARDIVLAAEPYFEILLLESGRFGPDRPESPRAWRCLMRKRDA